MKKIEKIYIPENHIASEAILKINEFCDALNILIEQSNLRNSPAWSENSIPGASAEIPEVTADRMRKIKNYRAIETFSPQEGWEELFDKGFVWEGGLVYGVLTPYIVHKDKTRQLALPQYFKAFIRGAISQADQDGYKRGFNDAKAHLYSSAEVPAKKKMEWQYLVELAYNCIGMNPSVMDSEFQREFERIRLQVVQEERARLREKVKQLHGGGYIHHEEPFVSENGVLSLLNNDTAK